MLKFLKKQAKSTFEKVANICAGYICAVLITLGTIKFYKWLFEVDQSNNFSFTIFSQFSYNYRHPFWIEFFFACIIAPLAEEYLFRAWILQVVRETKEKLLVPTIIFSSLIFGLMHQGAISIPIQGAFGFIAACVYVKNGYSYVSSVTLHFLWNFSLLVGILHV